MWLSSNFCYLIKYGTDAILFRMAELFIEDTKMSSPTQGSQQLLTTLCKQHQDGYLLANVHEKARLSERPELEGIQYGCLKIVSQTVISIAMPNGTKTMVTCQCSRCGAISVRYYGHVKFRPSCFNCLKISRQTEKDKKTAEKDLLRNKKDAMRIPEWLRIRAKGMQERCENQSHKHYKNYGGRGIEFRFVSARSCARWVLDNLGACQSKELDRIDNNGHYEPGNLRWASKSLNGCNSRRGGWMAMVHKFRMDHPEIRYADKTLRNLISLGFDQKQIIDRYYQKSDKPKGMYGTYLTPDPEIASLARDF